MRRTWKRYGIVVCTALMIVPSMALADDVFTLPWTRGDARTTYQNWEFDNPPANNPPASNIEPIAGPDSVDNDYGTPTSLLINSGDAQWHSSFESKDGVWELFSGENFWLTVPTLADPDNAILAFIQVTWHEDGVQPVVNALVHAGIPDQANPLGGPIEVADVGGGWFVSTFSMANSFSPSSVDFFIAAPQGGEGFDSYIDQIIIDTYTVPVPAALSFMGAFGMALVVRRKPTA